MSEVRNRRHNRRFEDGRRSVVESPRLPEEDTGSLLAVLQECITEGRIFKASYMKLVQYLRNTDYKRMNLQFLSEDSCFFVMKSLNTWVVDIYTEAANQELPSHILTLTEFYHFAVRNFKSRIQSERMWIAYSYFLNNMALVSLRDKQYSKCIQYLEQVSDIYDQQGIPHCIFSIVSANLATLYRRLNDLSSAEYYIGQATKISKDLMNQMITDRARQEEIAEVANLLATEYSAMVTIIKNSAVLKETEGIILELVQKNFVRLTNRIWYVKNFVDKVKKGMYRRPFHSTFHVNLEEFRFYNQIGRGETPPTVTKMPSLSLPPINLSFANTNSGANKKEQKNGMSHQGTPLKRRYADSTGSQDEALKIPSNDTSPFTNTHYRKEIKEQYSVIESQHKELKQAIDTILKKQSDTESVLQSLIIPKIVDFVTNAPNVPAFSNLNPVLNTGDSKTLELNGVVFRNLRLNMEFVSEGIIITSFRGTLEEKLQWSSVIYILKNLELLEIFENELDLANNQHQLAKLLFSYMEFEKTRIKIGRYPKPTFSLKVSPVSYLHFYHIHDREFKLAYIINNRLDLVVRCEFCEKSFPKYFKTHKIDDYYEDIKQKMINGPTKKRDFYIDVVRYLDNMSLENELISIIMNFERVVDQARQNWQRGQEKPLFKLHLQFDEYQNSNLFKGTLFIVTSKDKEERLEVVVHNLNALAQDPNESKLLIRYLPYWRILEDYGVDYTRLKPQEREHIKYFTCDKYQIKVDTIKNQRVSKNIVYLVTNQVETYCFVQRFIIQKYLRPARLSVVGANKKIQGIRYSLYNECFNNEESFFVLCQPTTDKARSNHTDASKQSATPNQSMLEQLVKKVNIDRIAEKMKKQQKTPSWPPIMHLETFLQMFM